MCYIVILKCCSLVVLKNKDSYSFQNMSELYDRTLVQDTTLPTLNYRPTVSQNSYNARRCVYGGGLQYIMDTI